MKKKNIALLFIVLFLRTTTVILSQNVAINTSGNSPYTSAILDLSNQNTAGTVGFLPPYVTLTSLTTFGLSGTAAQSSGIVVYCTGLSAVPAGLYYWNNTGGTWVAMGGASLSGGTNNYLARWTGATTLGKGVTQDNGSAVGISSSAITPKSMLDVNGGVAIGTYAGATAAPSNGVIVSGQSGFGNNAPASSSVVDFTNTQAGSGTGAPILWPVNPAPSTNISSPVLGEEVYNTTTGCFNFYNGTTWVVNGCPCNIAPATPTIGVSCSQSFQGSSITYTSSITTGVSFSWTVTATTGIPVVIGNGTSSITVTWPSGGAGTGSVVLSLANLCGTSTATQAVTINVNPTITGTTPIYESSAGNSFSCTQAGATYSWSSNNTNEGIIVGSATGQSVNVTASAVAGTFTLTCTVSFGACSQILTYPVSVTCPSGVSIAFAWNGTVNYQNGSVQTWTVPACISTITIVAAGAAGTASDGNNGGDGATITATVTVVGGDVLDIVVGGQGSNPGDWGAGGGGGSFVWDASSSTYPLVAAGGGGGAGTVSAGGNGSIAITPTSGGTDGAAGTNGNGGTGGTATKNGPGGGGGGWNSAGTLAAATTTSAQGGLGKAGGFTGGNGASNTAGSTGGYGGGGGGGYNGTSLFGGGGGGGGYNGGGGGSSTTNANQYGGGGGGTGYYNAGYPYTTTADFVSPLPANVTQTVTGNGSVTIYY